MRYTAILLILIGNSALADAITIGPKGIDSKATELDGAKIVIGQIEPRRSGKPGYGIPPEDSASNTKPAQVYFQAQVALPGEAVGQHATGVAGVMIGDDTVGGGLFEGVAPKANLHSAAFGGSPGDMDVDRDDDFSLTADRLARIIVSDPDDSEHPWRMRAINVSVVRELRQFVGEDTNGNSHVTKFVDWSAARHDVLYVVAWGNNYHAPKRAPTDNFNGITVAASQQVDPDNNDTAYRKFGTINATFGHAEFPRYSIDLLAPGQLSWFSVKWNFDLLALAS